MNFRSKFNHSFTNRDCFHCAILRAQKARGMRFLHHNIQHKDFQDFENV